MDPFNIIINTGDEQIDLNIHPQEMGTYKIVYHGALIGEIFLGADNEKWDALTADELQPGGFPVYEYDETSGHQHILLDERTVQEIGRKMPR
ncbi:hypothetical protein QG516_03365 [Pedobacter gandavensis]|uniref:hypothetical protein n=1 Tax=Pedobacter gandavensis TaxID=2679963 RepID=UPI002479EF8D|nr:hypothetical protein [Pedobacter gandavensis]WGQ10693.1 hypothetical protein QG516_03365 [Pedobacter gandavensis]